jgi:peptidoglycan/LPS O-acetylase OafA/YrhL
VSREGILVPTTATPNQSDHIRTLDGLRAVAILCVIVCHVFADNHKVVALGHMGVLIFFALSGYLITTRLVMEYQSNGHISLRNFYIRRAFRILPPSLAYLGILSILSALGIVACSPQVIRSAIFFYTNYINVGKGWYAGHFWSLSVEEHFYLIWPCLLIGFGVCTGWRIAFALVLAIFVWRIADFHLHILARALHDPFLQWYGYRTDLIADTLLWGCCLAFVKLKAGRISSTAIAACSATLLALLCQDTRLPFLPHNISLLTPIEHLLPAILIGAVVACPSAPIGQVLELEPMRLIGKWSYSLYIWQQLFLWGPDGPRMPAAIGICAAFVCAYLSYRFIEQPFIRIGRRVTMATRRPQSGSRSELSDSSARE